MNDTPSDAASPFAWTPTGNPITIEQERHMNETQKRILRDHMHCVLSEEKIAIPYDLFQEIIDKVYSPHSHRDLGEQLEHMADNFRAKVEDREMESKELLDRLAEAITEEEDLYQTRGNSRAL